MTLTLKKFPFFISVLICAMCICATCLFAENKKPDINIVLNKMEQANVSVADVQFKYSQEIVYQSAGETEISFGEIKYKDKNHIYIHKNPPSEQYVYICGSKITTYVPDNKQAIVENWKNLLNSDSILFTVIDFNKNWKTFKKNNIIKSEYETDRNFVISVKSNNPSVKWKMFVEIDKETGIINKSVYSEGDISMTISFSDYKYNNNFDEKTFKFNPSDDIDIIDF